jgi:deoxyadenosine/deoxycytidine kinase
MLCDPLVIKNSTNRVAGIISIQGNIGAGKTLFFKLLQSKLSELGRGELFHFLKEPVEEWKEMRNDQNKDLLTLFYEDQRRYGFMFQVNAFTSRINSLLKAIESWPSPELIGRKFLVTERSTLTDKLFFGNLHAQKLVDDLEWKIYCNFHHMICEDILQHEKIFIWIKTDPKKCHSRCTTRNREGEENISLAYLEQIDEAHSIMFEELAKDKKNEILHVYWETADPYEQQFIVRGVAHRLIQLTTKNLAK